MQIPQEWIPTIFSYLTMIGTLILFVATRAEKLSTTEQVRLFRKDQREGRLIDTISEDIRILKEISNAIEGFQKSKDIRLKHEFKFRIEQLTESLTRLSWRSGPFTDAIAKVANQAYRIVIGAPAYRKIDVVANVDRLSDELAAWLKKILSEEI